MNSSESDSYEQIFIHFSNFIERWIIHFITLLLVLLIIIQTLMQSPMLRIWLSTVERWEGISYDEVSLLPDEMTMLKNDNQDIDFLQQL